MSAPLVAPLDVRPAPAVDRARRLRRIGAALLVLAALAGVSWAWRYSPIGYDRFDVFEDQHEVELRPGGYTVFEEFDGASDGDQLPTPIEVVVVDEDGRPVPVDVAQPAGVRGAPDAYDTFWHEGRAVAEVTIDREGAYEVSVAFRRGGEGQYRAFERVTMAIGRRPALAFVAGPLGAIAFVGVPAGAGVGCLLAARRRGRRARRAG